MDECRRQLQVALAPPVVHPLEVECQTAKACDEPDDRLGPPSVQRACSDRRPPQPSGAAAFGPGRSTQGTVEQVLRTDRGRLYLSVPVLQEMVGVPELVSDQRVYAPRRHTGASPVPLDFVRLVCATGTVQKVRTPDVFSSLVYRPRMAQVGDSRSDAAKPQRDEPQRVYSAEAPHDDQ